VALNLLRTRAARREAGDGHLPDPVVTAGGPEDRAVVLRVDDGGLTRRLRGAAAVAEQARLHFGTAQSSRPALVNGSPGLVTVPDGGPLYSVLAFTVRDGRVVAIDVLSDPNRLARIAFA
jgi:hypothetical protein